MEGATTAHRDERYRIEHAPIGSCRANRVLKVYRLALVVPVTTGPLVLVAEARLKPTFADDERPLNLSEDSESRMVFASKPPASASPKGKAIITRRVRSIDSLRKYTGSDLSPARALMSRAQTHLVHPRDGVATGLAMTVREG